MVATSQNHFAKYFDRPIESPYTEQWFENTDLGVKGKIDLVHNPTQLLDYKSGSKKSAKDVVKHSNIESPTDKPNFQALLYLTQQRSERPDQRLQFTFFHFLETLDDVVTGRCRSRRLSHDGDVLSDDSRGVHRDRSHLH